MRYLPVCCIRKVVCVLLLLIPWFSEVAAWGAPSSVSLSIDARSAVLFDALSGQVIFEQNSQERMAPASLTKLLTLYITFDELKRGVISLEDEVLVSRAAWKTGGSKMFIKAGERVKLGELMEGIAVVSGNDACVAVAEYIAGVEEAFVARMNEKARDLRMVHSHFENVHGLPAAEQYTTALDIGLLAYHYLKDHPYALRIHSIKQFTFAGITQRNRNGLLWLDEGVDGLKTGWIDNNGGFHLVATASRNGQRFIAVVMGARNPRTRENEALKLLNFGFRNFSTVRLFQEGEPVAQVEVWKGKRNLLSLIAKESGIVTVPQGEEATLALVKNLPQWIDAPVRRGEVVGKIEISKNGEVYKRVDLIAQEEVPRAGIFKYLLDTTLHSIIIFPYWGALTITVCVLFLILIGIVRRKRKNTHPFGILQ